MVLIPTLPLRPRNRLAHLIVSALSDVDARRELAALATAAAPPAEWTAECDAHRAPLIAKRARAATDALEGQPILSPATSLADALRAAALLFDAGLGFETHEVLESHWSRAEGAARESLQGLIQVAVGYQHLANGNLAGARALLREGGERLEAGGLSGIDLGAFRTAVTTSLASSTDRAALTPPRFPRAARAA